MYWHSYVLWLGPSAMMLLLTHWTSFNVIIVADAVVFDACFCAGY